MALDRGSVRSYSRTSSTRPLQVADQQQRGFQTLVQVDRLRGRVVDAREHAQLTHDGTMRSQAVALTSTRSSMHRDHGGFARVGQRAGGHRGAQPGEHALEQLAVRDHRAERRVDLVRDAGH